MALKILLADDNITAQRLGAKILSDAGHEVIAVSNGAAAVKKIASERPDMLILDVYMPGYSGLEVCARVKGASDTARLPVLLSVTSMEPFTPEEGNRVKADGVMIKPFIASDLLAVIGKFEQKLRVSAPATAVQEPVIEHNAGVEDWNSEVAQEEQPDAAPVQVPHEIAVTPALGIDDTQEMSVAPAAPFEVAAPAPAPAFGAGSVALETAAPVFAEADPVFAATAEPAHTVPEIELELPAETAVQPPAEMAGATGVEFTSAPQVGNIDIAQAPELEITVEEPAEQAVIAQDPALVTTPEEMAEFTTVFGADHPEDVPVGIAMAEPEPDASSELDRLVNEEVRAMKEHLGAEAGMDTVPIEVLPEAPAGDLPVAELGEAGVDTAPIPSPLEAGEAIQPQPVDVSPEPEPQLSAEAVVSEPEPIVEPASEPIEIEVTPEPELQHAVAVGAAAAAVAPAREEPVISVETAPVDSPAAQRERVVAQLAAEFDDSAQMRHETEAAPEQPKPEFEAEPPAAAALPAAAPADEERILAAVTSVLDRYVPGFKQEMLAAIVRELKK